MSEREHLKFLFLKAPHPNVRLEVREDHWHEDASKRLEFQDGKHDGAWYRFVFVDPQRTTKAIYLSEAYYKPIGKTLAEVSETKLNTLFPADEWPRFVKTEKTKQHQPHADRTSGQRPKRNPPRKPDAKTVARRGRREIS